MASDIPGDGQEEITRRIADFFGVDPSSINHWEMKSYGPKDATTLKVKLSAQIKTEEAWDMLGVKH